jgi:cell division protein FtsZ
MEDQNENIEERRPAPRIIADDTPTGKAKVKVVGVGGAGGNAVNRMIKMGISGVEFISINTDALALENSLADEKVAIGQKITKTLGAGAKPDVGRKAIQEDREIVADKLKGADLVFIAAGMGGGTGTGAAPVVGEIARKLGILTVAVVSMPFKWEGPVRRRNAQNGVNTLRENVDTIIVINNQKVLDIIEKNTTVEQAFTRVDEVLGNAVRSVCDIMFRNGTIHVDFNDIRSVLENGGAALMGTGIADGEDRALRAAEAAIKCPLLEDVNIAGASGVLVNISHGENFSMAEFAAANDYIYDSVGEVNNPSIIMGDITIPELGDKVSITVVAAGFAGHKETLAEQTGAAAAVSPAMIATPAVNAVPQHLEQATPRPTTNFAALAGSASASVQEAPRSVPQQTAAPEAAPAIVTEEPDYRGSYAESRLDVRASQTEEEVIARPQAEPAAAPSPVPSAVMQQRRTGLQMQMAQIQAQAAASMVAQSRNYAPSAYAQPASVDPQHQTATGFAARTQNAAPQPAYIPQQQTAYAQQQPQYMPQQPMAQTGAGYAQNEPCIVEEPHSARASSDTLLDARINYDVPTFLRNNKDAF